MNIDRLDTSIKNLLSKFILNIRLKTLIKTMKILNNADDKVTI